VIIIDDAHLMDILTLRKLRLLLEDFPKNHNVILIGQPELLDKINLSVNADIKSRITYSVITKRLNPDDLKAFILAQLDQIKLGHNTFSEDALELIRTLVRWRLKKSAQSVFVVHARRCPVQEKEHRTGHGQPRAHSAALEERR